MNNTRVAKWDNLKFFMILCVVTGHFLGEMISGDYLGQAIYVFIYTFHMPVFIFLAGMFSKRSVEQKKFEVIIEYMMIYLFMKVLDNLANCLKYSRAEGFPGKQFFMTVGKSILNGRDNFHFFWEDGPGWFAFAMAIFLFITMLIKDYNRKYMLIVTIFIGCLAGLDKHLGPVNGMGNHFSAMRICVFYPVFLVGYYMNPDAFLFGGKKTVSLNKEKKEMDSHVKKWIITIIAIAILLLCFLLCLRLNRSFTVSGITLQNGVLYALRDFLKGKCTYYNIGNIANPVNPGENMVVGIGLWGILLRLGCYIVWGILIFAIIFVCPEKEFFWSWLGQRTMSVFIWHKFFIIIFLYLCNGKNYIFHHLEHTYLLASLCFAVIITVLTSYLPGLRISGKLKKKSEESIGKKENYNCSGN